MTNDENVPVGVCACGGRVSMGHVGLNPASSCEVPENASAKEIVGI